MTDRELERFARSILKRLDSVEKNVYNLSKPQLHRAALHDGSIDEYKAKEKVSVIGRQFDGGHGVVALIDPIPPTPTPAIVTGGRGGSVGMRWDGIFMGVDSEGNPAPDILIIAPTYWSRVEFHISPDPNFTALTADTLVDTAETPRGATKSAPVDPGTYYVRLVSRSKSGKASPASAPVQVVLEALPDYDQVVAEMQEDADAAVAAADSANAAALAAQADAAASSSAASTAVAEAQAAAASAEAAEIDANASAADVSSSAAAADAAAADAAAALQNAIDAGNNASAAQAAADNAQAFADTAAAEATAAGTSAANADASAAQAAADAAQAVADAAAAAQSAQTATDAATQAAEDAGLAQEAASQTSHIFWTVNEPAWIGDPDTANWFQQETASGPTIAWWRWDGTDFVKMDVGEAFLPQINIGTGTFGDLSGNRITTRSLKSRHLVLQDYQNLFPDLLVEPEGWTLDPGVTIANSALAANGKQINLVQSTTETRQATGDYITVLPGDQIYVRASVIAALSTSSELFLSWYGYDETGTYLGETGDFASEGTVRDEPILGSFVVPVGVSQVRIAIKINPNATADTRSVYNLEARRMIKGTNSLGTTIVGPQGIQTFNPEGGLATQLGIFGNDFLSVSDGQGSSVAGISQEGTLSGHGLNIEEDPTIMGLPLLGDFGPWESPSALSHNGWMDQMPRGIVARGYNNIQGRTVQGGYMEIGEIGFDLYPGRMYRVCMEPAGVYTTNSYNYLFVGETTDGSRPTQANHSQVRRYAMRNNHADSIMLPVGFSMYHYDGANTTNVGAPKRCRLLFWLQTPDSDGTLTLFGAADGGTFRVFVEDIGPFLEDTLIDRTGKTGTSEPPPEPDEQTYTKTYVATDTRSYQGNGSWYNFNTNKMYQGQSPAGYGDLQSIAIFPNMTGDLSGATITSMRTYFYFEHWYYNSGGTARIGVHNQTSLPSNQPTIYEAKASTNWPRPGGRWVNIPSSFWAGFKNGTHRGVALGRANGGLGEYGIARDNCKIEIKYKK